MPKSRISSIALGMAMFSMFFGSGNIIFPVLVGKMAQENVGWALLGLIITAVIVPCAGLLTIALFDGNYMQFFGRLGKLPAWGLVLGIMGLCGPFGVIPRCIILSHSSLNSLGISTSIFLYSLISCVLIFFSTFRRKNVLAILGKGLTPILLASIFAIIGFGLLTPSFISPASEALTPTHSFFFGLKEGYNTMDLFASFLFSGAVLHLIRDNAPTILANPKELTRINLKASAIGMGLLATMYIGLSIVAAKHTGLITNTSPESMLSTLSMGILGSWGGYITCIAVSLACITTAMSLAMVFAEFLCEQILPGKINYTMSLVATLLITLLISTLEFSGIQNILVPVLQLTLPSLIGLVFLNFLFKHLGFRPVRLPILLIFLGTVFFFYR